MKPGCLVLPLAGALLNRRHGRTRAVGRLKCSGFSSGREEGALVTGSPERTRPPPHSGALCACNRSYVDSVVVCAPPHRAAMLQQLREYEAVVRASHAPQSNNVALASSDQQQQQQQLGALQFDLSAVAGPQGAQGLGQAVPTNVVDGGAAPLFQLQGGQQQAPQVPGAHLFLFSGGAPAPSAQGFVFGSNHTASQGSEG